MATIPNEMRFLGVNSSLIDLAEKKDSTNNEKTEYYSLDDIRGYKIFTALLTQSGEGSFEEMLSGNLTIGVSYMIGISHPGDDFTNVGGPLITSEDEYVNTYFIATGTTPNNWTNNTGLEYNPGAPVVTVLENTIGNVWFTRDNIGTYNIRTNGMFSTNKTIIFIGTRNISASASSGVNYAYDVGSINNIEIFTVDSSDIQQDDNLYNTPIEIRVYN